MLCHAGLMIVCLRLCAPSDSSPMLEMLMAREQLMEDIISIVDGMLENVKIVDADKEMMIERLCDAVCKNFPTN